ncbi:hypothetical protein [[Phormidium] sp. ETS-05]|uniref:hypothetical protein n=1 Tax=[Phormidium] sp. ETS-05 TaxID=222819 RepID=UPI0018EF1F99|nr:hypothetical protein [[Phormidium] sp. ETS-05]
MRAVLEICRSPSPPTDRSVVTPPPIFNCSAILLAQLRHHIAYLQYFTLKKSKTNAAMSRNWDIMQNDNHYYHQIGKW